ncbi:MAG: hypothetical protein KAI24_24490, partial [Planctomycetes bacterium]|nr:hypothetical protein [Planctomycetota bacterium]
STFGARLEWSPLSDLLPLVDALLVQAGRSERPAARLDAWLDALATGVDLCGLEYEVGQLIGATVVQRAVARADEAWLASLPDAQLRRLAAALEAADASLPVPAATAPSIVHLVMLVERDDLTMSDLGFLSASQLWRYGFSAWHAGLERVGRAVAMLRAFERETPADESWPDRYRRLQELERRDAEANADLLMPYFANVAGMELERRTALAALRRLRGAVAAALGDVPPRLRDPLR